MGESHKSLGCKMSPTATEIHQLSHWKEKEQKFVMMLKHGNLTTQDATILYKRIYIPTIKYIMSFTSMISKEVHAITKSTAHLFLNKIGYATTTSRDLVYDPETMGGLGWYDLEIEQGLHNLEKLISGYHEQGAIGSITEIMPHQWSWLLGIPPLGDINIMVLYDESNGCTS